MWFECWVLCAPWQYFSCQINLSRTKEVFRFSNFFKRFFQTQKPTITGESDFIWDWIFNVGCVTKPIFGQKLPSFSTRFLHYGGGFGVDLSSVQWLNNHPVGAQHGRRRSDWDWWTGAALTPFTEPSITLCQYLSLNLSTLFISKPSWWRISIWGMDTCT